MRRLALALAAFVTAGVVAVELVRRRVPTYPTWADYLEDDDEGDALEPDVYLVALLARGQGED